MPKLIDYPRTGYAGAWEVADVVDDTGGKCALDTCARKLNRKVSGSFKAIVGSAVKFGLLTSKRELLTTTTLFRRIKHAYDKQEELVFHREAFLTPPLITQLCRKFRSRELPAQMLDIMLIREFDVEEINAQGVAKAFIDGARMVGLLDERNMIADIDQLAAQQPPRRELASPELGANSFRAEVARDLAQSTVRNAPGTDPFVTTVTTSATFASAAAAAPARSLAEGGRPKPARPANTESQSQPLPAAPLREPDAVASLFGLAGAERLNPTPAEPKPKTSSSTFAGPDQAPSVPDRGNSLLRLSGPELSGSEKPGATATVTALPVSSLRTQDAVSTTPIPAPTTPLTGFRIELAGPGINTVLEVQDEDDLALARALLDKIGRQLKQQ